jgi:hypothetical protein
LQDTLSHKNKKHNLKRNLLLRKTSSILAWNVWTSKFRHPTSCIHKHPNMNHSLWTTPVNTKQKMLGYRK